MDTRDQSKTSTLRMGGTAPAGWCHVPAQYGGLGKDDNSDPETSTRDPKRQPSFRKEVSTWQGK